MSPFPYDQLWHYSEKFSRDPDLRQDLVLMAYQQDKRFGDRSEIRLLKHYMKLRAKEVHKRNSLGKQIGGKSKKDIYRCERLSIHKPLPEGSMSPIADMLSCAAFDPLGLTVVNQFDEALSHDEQTVCNGMIAGYPVIDVKAKLRIHGLRYQELKAAVREKALEYLV
jgi:hypothetical protein